ncbi:MAG: 6-phosphofructokinase [Chloroflexi bacterium]|nr:6-phosphofructokinase [Chloroflexota bacterium]
MGTTKGKKYKKIAVLTSGGDAPGMNACIRAVTRGAMDRGAEVLGIKRGYTGLFTKNFIELNSRTVANTIQRGGTILESSRCEEMRTPEGRKIAAGILQDLGVDGLVVIGGNGSYRGAAALSKETKTRVVGIPGTIDNDIYGTDYTVGFDTAINTALEAIDRIRDTADAFERVFFIEVMGRKSGFIALEVGIAGGAEEILIPEIHIEPEQLAMTLKQSFDKGKRSSIVVIAEGNESGHTIQIAQYIQYRLNLDCRVCVLGHLQRGGTPTARDRVLGSRLGTAAVEGLFNGKNGHAVGEVGGEIVFTSLIESAENTKSLDVLSLDAKRVLSL